MSILCVHGREREREMVRKYEYFLCAWKREGEREREIVREYEYFLCAWKRERERER